MNQGSKLKLIIGVGLALVLVVGFASVTGWYNSSVSLEEGIKAQYMNNKNEYDAFWKKVKEVAQVPDKYKEDFKEVLVSETEAKFGEGGSNAVMQWFKDRDINFDATQYTRIQDVIESGRNDFKRAQTELLDKQRKYRTHLKTFKGKMVGSLFSFPNPVGGELAPAKDLDGDGFLTVLDYPIVTSQKTEKAFAEGQDEALDVFN